MRSAISARQKPGLSSEAGNEAGDQDGERRFSRSAGREISDAYDKGIRENESQMKSLGFNTWLHCYLSYVVWGAFASVAGVAWAYYNGFVSPTYLDLTASSELFLMAALGGPGTLVRPAFGAGAHRPAEECHQRLYAAMAVDSRRRLHPDHLVCAAGAVEPVEAPSYRSVHLQVDRGWSA